MMAEDNTDNSTKDGGSRGNEVLNALPPSSLERLRPHLRPMQFEFANVLHESGSENEVVFFPGSGIISLLLTSSLGIEVEVGLVGREGAVGFADALGRGDNFARAQVQIAGNGWRLSSAILRETFEKDVELQRVVQRYLRSRNSSASQNIMCNRLHTMEQRYAKWLLLVQDRISSPEVEITHEFLAAMLGSRRSVVTLTAQSLRDAGLIDYRRGGVTVLDRAGLEHVACECYQVLRMPWNG